MFVSITTGSCTGFCFRFVAGSVEAASVRRAVDTFNTDERSDRRGCDGNAGLHATEADLVAFWNERLVDGELRSFDEIAVRLSDDGEAYLCDALELAAYLESPERIEQNALPHRLTVSSS